MRSREQIVGLLDSLGDGVDPVGDAVVRQLIADNELGVSHALFAQMPLNGSPVPQSAPASVRSYFEDTRSLPPWFDQSLAARGEKIYAEFGPECLVLLLFKSLPQGYSMWHVAQTLHITGRMTAPHGDVKVLTKRILETLQFLVNVMGPDGFSAQGRALVTTQKVRLIHATIRNMIPSSPSWGANWRAPLNQEEILMTMLTFSLVIIDGLRQLGIRLSKSDEEGILHLWKVVAHLLSLDEQLQPSDMAEARQMWAVIVERNRTQATSQGVDLAQAVLQYGESILPEELEFVPKVMLYHLNSKQVRRLLAIKSPGPLALLAIGPAEGVLWLMQSLRSFSPVARWLLRSINLSLIKGLINHWNANQPVSFALPEHLQAHWKIQGFCVEQGVGAVPVKAGAVSPSAAA